MVSRIKNVEIEAREVDVGNVLEVWWVREEKRRDDCLDVYKWTDKIEVEAGWTPIPICCGLWAPKGWTVDSSTGILKCTYYTESVLHLDQSL
jgi:hypothetical protein